MPPPLARFIRNATSMLASDVLNRATIFIVYALVARYLGAYAVGQLALALTLFYTFHVFASAGIKTLITREVAQDRTKTDEYLLGGSLIVCLCSSASFVALIGLVWLMDYGADTAKVIWLMSLGLLPSTLSVVTEGVLCGREHMHLIAFASVPVSIGRVLACSALLSRGHGLVDIIVVLVLCRVAQLAAEWCLLLSQIGRPRLAVNRNLLGEMLRQAMPFFGIEALVNVQPAIMAVLLSKLATETEVGLYNAGVQLLVPVSLVFFNVMVSVFPVLCRTMDNSLADARRLAEHLLESLLVFAVPAATGLFLLSSEVLVFVYGNEDFLQGSTVLRILVWTLILDAYTHTLGNVLMAGRREKMNLTIVAVDAVARLLVGAVLIGRFGLTGAAATATVVQGIDFLLHYILVFHLLAGIPVMRVLWKPVVASAVMASCLLIFRLPGLVAPIAAGVVLYAGAWLSLSAWSHGGLRPFADRYWHGWSEPQPDDPSQGVPSPCALRGSRP